MYPSFSHGVNFAILPAETAAAFKSLSTPFSTSSAETFSSSLLSLNKIGTTALAPTGFPYQNAGINFVFLTCSIAASSQHRIILEEN